MLRVSRIDPRASLEDALSPSSLVTPTPPQIVERVLAYECGYYRLIDATGSHGSVGRRHSHLYLRPLHHADNTVKKGVGGGENSNIS